MCVKCHLDKFVNWQMTVFAIMLCFVCFSFSEVLFSLGYASFSIFSIEFWGNIKKISVLFIEKTACLEGRGM